jgi:hypothetical protein
MVIGPWSQECVVTYAMELSHVYRGIVTLKNASPGDS